MHHQKYLVLALFLFFAGHALAASVARPIKIMREGQAVYHALDPAKLHADTPLPLFSGEIAGTTFDLFVRDVDAQPLTIELGFVDTQSNGPAQHTFAVAANGSPLDANLDVWAKAGGAYKPWVMKTTFNHSGGSLSIMFSGLDKPAFVSYARITNSKGAELAFATASDWKHAERLTLLDSRSHPFHKVKVGDVCFFDVDHSPVGSWSTFIYGMEASGGVQVCKQPGGDGTLVPDQGVIIAAKRGAEERIMPFASKQKSLPNSAWITGKEVTRTLGACTDHWDIPMGVSWTHFTAVWALKDWNQASPEEQRRFTLPATWMQYNVDNRSGKEELQLLFSLEQPAVRNGCRSRLL